MGTSMIGRVAALLNQDLSRSLVIFLALARGQELIVFILITGSMIVYGLRSRGCLVHEMGKGIKD
jgi:ABC-type transport system involved in cytochrome c biogenesis permease component